MLYKSLNWCWEVFLSYTVNLIFFSNLELPEMLSILFHPPCHQFHPNNWLVWFYEQEQSWVYSSILLLMLITHPTTSVVQNYKQANWYYYIDKTLGLLDVYMASIYKTKEHKPSVCFIALFFPQVCYELTANSRVKVAWGNLTWEDRTGKKAATCCPIY